MQSELFSMPEASQLLAGGWAQRHHR